MIDQKNSLSKDGNVIPQVYNQVKKDLSSGATDRPPLVYGLATSFSSSVIGLSAMFTMLLTLLIGDGLSPSVLLITLCLYLALEIYTAEKISSHKLDSGKYSPLQILCNGIFYWGYIDIKLSDTNICRDCQAQVILSST